MRKMLRGKGDCLHGMGALHLDSGALRSSGTAGADVTFRLCFPASALIRLHILCFSSISGRPRDRTLSLEHVGKT